MRPIKITILYDGAEETDRAAEIAQRGQAPPLMHEVLAPTLRELGHEVRVLAAGPISEFVRELAEDDADLYFNVCEGLAGQGDKEPHVAALLELCGKRFTGAGSAGLSLAGDKALAKKLLDFHGISTPRFSLMEAGTVDHADDLAFPMFVKPSNADASIGIDHRSVVHNLKELLERISFIQTEFRAPALIEEFIDGREIYVSVLQREQRVEALPVVEWDFSSVPEGTPRIASAEAKWDTDSPRYRNAKELVVRDLPEVVERALRDTALEAFRTLRLRDYGRVDMRLRQRAAATDAPGLPKGASESLREAAAAGWDIYIIEVNPNPHLATDSELPLAASAAGLTYPELIGEIVRAALDR